MRKTHWGTKFCKQKKNYFIMQKLCKKCHKKKILLLMKKWCHEEGGELFSQIKNSYGTVPHKNYFQNTK